MNRVFLDTNVLLDIVVATRAAHEQAVEAIRGCSERGVACLVLASSLKDVYYIARRHYGDEGFARETVRMLRDAFVMVELTRQIVDAALSSDEPDYEDGLIRAAAELCGCDHIISRDEDAFAKSRLRRLDAAGLLSALG